MIKSISKEKVNNVSFSGVDYAKLYKHGFDSSKTIKLVEKDKETMEMMGFLEHQQIDEQHKYYWYQKGLKYMSFYANGKAKYLDREISETPQYTFLNVKKAIQFLWNIYSPVVNESLYKNFMLKLLEE